MVAPRISAFASVVLVALLAVGGARAEGGAGRRPAPPAASFRSAPGKLPKATRAAPAPPSQAAVPEKLTLHDGAGSVERQVVEVRPNVRRGDYLELTLHREKERWLFRPDIHVGAPERASRTPAELAYFHTSDDLGLDVVPKVVKATWRESNGTLQRVVEAAQVSSGTVEGDHRMVAGDRAKALRVDFDSLHALAIQHFVTKMRDDWTYNILVSKAPDGSLRYSAIDGERALGLGDMQYFHRSNGVAAALVLQSFSVGGPRQLSPALQQRLRKTNVAAWRKHLEENGVAPEEVDGAVARLRAVQEHGLDAVLGRPGR